PGLSGVLTSLIGNDAIRRALGVTTPTTDTTVPPGTTPPGTTPPGTTPPIDDPADGHRIDPNTANDTTRDAILTALGLYPSGARGSGQTLWGPTAGGNGVSQAVYSPQSNP